MRENRQSGSEGGGTEPNRFSLPLSKSKDKNTGKTPVPRIAEPPSLAKPNLGALRVFAVKIF